MGIQSPVGYVWRGNRTRNTCDVVYQEDRVWYGDKPIGQPDFTYARHAVDRAWSIWIGQSDHGRLLATFKVDYNSRLGQIWFKDNTRGIWNATVSFLNLPHKAYRGTQPNGQILSIHEGVSYPGGVAAIIAALIM